MSARDNPYTTVTHRRGPTDLDAYAAELLKQVQHYATPGRDGRQSLVLVDIYLALEQLACECAWLQRRVEELEARDADTR